MADQNSSTPKLPKLRKITPELDLDPCPATLSSQHASGFSSTTISNSELNFKPSHDNDKGIPQASSSATSSNENNNLEGLQRELSALKGLFENYMAKANLDTTTTGPSPAPKHRPNASFTVVRPDQKSPDESVHTDTNIQKRAHDEISLAPSHDSYAQLSGARDKTCS